ncbi:MAG TPA: hypothetical protein VD866_06270 [Urbifossiella sp.]|nr:hypothetical protein [Urbifossiella sp.]
MTRVLSVAALCGLGVFASAADYEVVGKSGGTGGHRWEFGGKASGKAAVGKADDRLQVKVKNGDTVSFKIEGGTHGVLFEKAKTEMGAGVWEVVKDSGTLKDLPSGAGFDRFDRKDAQTTDAKGPGSKLIEFRIKNLKAGAGNGILFACNPHSALGDPASTTMLGVIVLDEAEKK